MSTKLLKRVLAVAMATTLMVVPITAGATDSSDSSSSSTTANAEAVQPTSQVVAGGAVIKNEAPGAFQIKADSPISGVAVTESAAEIKQAAGLAANETPFVSAYTVDRKKSNLLYASLDYAAASLGGTLLGAINVDLGKLTGGKFTELPAGVSVPFVMGIKNYDPNKTYYIVKALPGGAIEEVPCTVVNGRISFNITGGLSGYGLVVR